MEFIINDGKTVICPECYAHIHMPEPVRPGQVIQCHACRLRIQVFEADGKLGARILPESAGTEDRTW